MWYGQTGGRFESSYQLNLITCSRCGCAYLPQLAEIGGGWTIGKSGQLRASSNETTTPSTSRSHSSGLPEYAEVPDPQNIAAAQIPSHDGG